MLKELIVDKDKIVCSLKEINQKIESEKRNLSADEKTQIEKLRSELSEITSKIELQRTVEENERKEVAKELNTESKKGEFNVQRAFKAFLAGEKYHEDDLAARNEAIEEFKIYGRSTSDQEFYIPSRLIPSMRATVTTSSAPEFGKTDQVQQLFVHNTELILPKLPITIYDDLEAGAYEVPNMAEITAAYGTEDNDLSDVTVNPDKITLTPRYLAASADFSRQLLTRTTPTIQAQLFDQFNFALFKANEREAFLALSALTETAGLTNGIAGTGTSATTFTDLTKLEAAVNFGNAYVTSRKAMAYMKNKERGGSGSGRFMWEDSNTANGYAIFASSQVPDRNVYFGDWKNLIVAYWGPLAIIRDEYTLRKKGAVGITVFRMSDVKIANNAAFAVYKKASN